jgi:hypothetical protein
VGGRDVAVGVGISVGIGVKVGRMYGVATGSGNERSPIEQARLNNITAMGIKSFFLMIPFSRKAVTA